MKTKILLLLVFAALSTSGIYAQKQKQKFPQAIADKKIGEYTIHLIPAGAGYGFDIIKNGIVLLHEMQNPFNEMPVCLPVKEDVFKIAGWFIDEIKATGKAPHKAPADLITELDIKAPGFNGN